VRLRFEPDREGLVGWSLRGATSAELDGLPTALSDRKPPGAARHPNGATKVDHLVVFSADLARTVAALEAAGLDLRRVREPSEPGPGVRQAFLRAGETIVEVVENPELEGGSARFWGITFRVADIDRTAELLGERLGEVRGAVQPGRRIATARRSAGLGLPVALISVPPQGAEVVANRTS
jgi:hypothetical protein